MTLEDLIYTRLADSESIAGKLVRFQGNPAIFYHKSPDDSDDRWEGPQYPHIDYVVDMQSNPGRHSSGAMVVNIWCSEVSIPPEDIEPDVIEALRDVFITPDGKAPYCLSWTRSAAFTKGGRYPETMTSKDPETMVSGIELFFEIYEFPSQESADPDPILAINEFAKWFSPDAIIIGKDQLQVFQTATPAHPLIYFHLLNLQSAEETSAVAWMEGTIAGHIFAPERVRLEWMRYFTDVLSYNGEVTMLDNSPMFMKQIKMNTASDPLTVGQLRISVRFGLLRRGYTHPLNEVDMDYPKFTTRRKVTWQD